MKRRFFNVHLSIIFNYLILALVGAAYLEAQIRRLPKPNKVRIVSIVMEPSPINQAPTVSAGSDQTTRALMAKPASEIGGIPVTDIALGQ